MNTREQRAADVRKLWEAGWKDEAIAAQLNVHPSTVQAYRKAAGLAAHQRHEDGPTQRARIAALNSQGMSDEAIGARLGICRNGVRYHRVRAGLPAVGVGGRPKAEAQR